MNIPQTEQIKFKDSKAAFAIGLDCKSTGRLKVEDVFVLDSTFVNHIKEINGTRKEKIKQNIIKFMVNHFEFIILFVYIYIYY